MSNNREVMYRGRPIQVSEHARFLATDESGDIFEYSLKPKPHDIIPAWEFIDGSKFRCVWLGNTPCEDWKDSLFEIDEEE